MLTESFVAATEIVKPPDAHLSSALKDVGIFHHEFQPQAILRQGFKKSSVAKNCLAISNTHIFAAQAGKAVVNVYNREKGNQEATIPFPQKISSLVYAEQSAILILGTQDGKLMLWEVATGRISTSSASHIEAVTNLVISPNGEHVISASSDSSIHVWSIRNLVSISKPQASFSNTINTRDPVSTFSQHRSAIGALVVGHSQHPSSNFIISASDDKMCYIWNLETLQVLRTVLLVQVPQCAVVDSTDRAVYFGSKDGSVQMIDMLGLQAESKASILDNSSRVAAIAIQLKAHDRWLPQGGSEPGVAQCITLSYDGTSLLTGHHSGKVLQWEAAKHRMTSEVSALSGQSVTNIQMLRPLGFLQSSSSLRFNVHTVVKPRLDLSSENPAPSVQGAIPIDYNFHAQIVQDSKFGSISEDGVALTSSEFPQSFLDAAVQSLVRNKISNAQDDGHSSTNGSSGSLHEIDRMEKEIVKLRSELENHQKLHQERIDTHTARLKRREAIGLQKRQAFFAAKKAGKNGDEAMKPFMQQEKEIDAESDEEAIARTTTGGHSHPVDLEMTG